MHKVRIVYFTFCNKMFLFGVYISRKPYLMFCQDYFSSSPIKSAIKIGKNLHICFCDKISSLTTTGLGKLQGKEILRAFYVGHIVLGS